MGNFRVTFSGPPGSGLTPVTSELIPIFPAGGPVLRPDIQGLPAFTNQSINFALASVLQAAVPGGASFTWPGTSLKAWRLTGPSFPVANQSCWHGYAEGGVDLSLPWGPAGDMYTVRQSIAFGGYRLMDFQMDVGIGNVRSSPGAEVTCFSQNPATPQRLYYPSGSNLLGLHTGSMTQDFSQGGMPSTDQWLQCSRNDTVITADSKASGLVWYLRNGVFVQRTFSGLDEHYLTNEGDYIVTNSSSSTVWNTTNNTIAARPAFGAGGFFHVPSLRNCVGACWEDAGGPGQPVARIDMNPLANVNIGTTSYYASDRHSCGNWWQPDSILPGGDYRKQWVMHSCFNQNIATMPSAILFNRADNGNGAAIKFLLHHYSKLNGIPANAGSPSFTYQYYSAPRGQLSGDGRLLLLDSNMNNSGRVDSFLIQMPLAVQATV